MISIQSTLAQSELYWSSHGVQGEKASLGGANLRDANLRDANLRGANLRGANLSDADLGDADLRGANLRGANLRGANLGGANLRDANLGGANLRDANLGDANLSDANLGGANLRGANLRGAIGLAPVTEDAIGLLLEFAQRVTKDSDALKMSTVHECETTHCGAGWICTLSPIAATLEKLLGWNVAACIACPIPEFTSLFYSTKDEMMNFAKSVVADQGDALRSKYGLPLKSQ